MLKTTLRFYFRLGSVFLAKVEDDTAKVFDAEIRIRKHMNEIQ